MTIMIEPATGPKAGQDSVGRTECNKLTVLPLGDYRLGDLVQVKITDATPHILRACLVNP